MSIASSALAETVSFYIGTYTGSGSKGIYVSKLDLATGALTEPELAAEVESPSFLAIHPSKQFVYAVNEVGNFQGGKTGAVSAFAVDATTGKLRLLNQQPSGGDGPCHISMDRQGKHVLIANYGGGSVAAFPVKPDGSLAERSAFVQHTGSSVNQNRQKEPHAHAINLDFQNNFAIAADLGLDKLLVYRFDKRTGALSPNDPPSASLKPGAGPRHFTFAGGPYLFALGELDSTINSFRYDFTRGALTPIESLSTLPSDFKGNNSTAEIRAHLSSKWIYASNRGHDSIAVFGFDPASGKLTHIENVSTQGKTPRNFGMEPTGKYLLAANQDSGNIVVFKIDPATGRLTPTGHSVKVAKPVCIRFLGFPS
ncbi:MAG TPA: lactonase family protein [Methylomirabilota bacterium]|nr:lactonase family protein [Methylomirabilota bacterium]